MPGDAVPSESRGRERAGAVTRTMEEKRPRLDDLRIERREEEPRPSQRRWPWVAAALVLVALALWWFGHAEAIEVVTAEARAVQASSSGTVLNASGYVTARRQATVSSKFTGKVSEVLIEEGMEVREGQVLARLDVSNLAAALGLSEAGLAAAKTALEETRVRLAEAELDLRRTERLVADAVASRSDLDRDRAEVDSLAARLARQRDEVTVAERRVAVERQALADAVIRAPFDGIVVAKNAQPGEMISPISAGGGFTRTGIGTIVDMDSLEIEVDVNEAYINRVRPEQEVAATLDAYPDWRIPARVIAIVPTADRQTATVRVRIGFEERDSRILPDMGVKVAFQAGEADEAPRSGVTVPAAALRQDGDRDVVFVFDGERVERRAVTVSGSSGPEVELTAGLRAGERVVVEGPADLADGARVQQIERTKEKGA